MLAFVIFVVLLILGIMFSESNGRYKTLGKILLMICITASIACATFFAMIIFSVSSVNSIFYTAAFIVFAIVVCVTVGCAFFGVIQHKKVYIPLLSVAAVCVVTTVSFFSYNLYLANIPEISENQRLLEYYDPYDDDSSVARLGEDPTLKLFGELPVMDGATALYPIYSAYTAALYPQEQNTFVEYNYSSSGGRYKQYKYTVCTTTTQAYKDIVDGKADIIFVAAPSESQRKYAENKGVELVYTPIGREAFVFFVNSKNPVDDVSLDEIRGIYSGEITHWGELGAKSLGEIKAYQRDEGSGSQSTLVQLMAGKKLVKAPTEEVINGMGGVFEKTSDYKNNKNAIGFSFRFYADEMIRNNGIKLLCVNGVAPTEKNIANGTYPIASEFYAVTRSDMSENTHLLLEWILSEQGQELIQRTGYTPLEAK